MDTPSPSHMEDCIPRYSRKNPPLTLSEAYARLDLLEEGVAGIKAQLAQFKATDYETDDEYYGWRRSAINALGYKEQEYQFIHGWVEGVFAPLKQSASDRVDKMQDLEELLRRTCAYATQLALEIGGSYSPQTNNKSRQRRYQISAVLAKLRAAQSQIHRLATVFALSAGQTIRVLEPLLEILNDAERELDQLMNPVRRN